MSNRPRIQFPSAPWDFYWLSDSNYLKIGTPVATLPGAWHYRVNTGTGWPSISIL